MLENFLETFSSSFSTIDCQPGVGARILLSSSVSLSLLSCRPRLTVSRILLRRSRSAARSVSDAPTCWFFAAIASLHSFHDSLMSCLNLLSSSDARAENADTAFLKADFSCTFSESPTMSSSRTIALSSEKKPVREDCHANKDYKTQAKTSQ
eukprot:TRINITY_DN4048_c0_g1_i2.p1 TRINITY_DN4048_c0_g1~~TRINITY_DN4048_c0_g1_i2.p1  ORF type:complete len:152 (+),score=2.12 TRINITY_DN4048_c0_g1_i2:278-733(+)